VGEEKGFLSACSRSYRGDFLQISGSRSGGHLVLDLQLSFVSSHAVFLSSLFRFDVLV
jgi:hypothetical protein